MRPFPHLRAAWLSGLVALLCLGCPSIEPPPAAIENVWRGPDAATLLHMLPGSPFLHSLRTEPPAHADGYLLVELRFYALQQFSDRLLAPLESHSQLIAATHSLQPLEPVARMLRGGRVGWGEPVQALWSRMQAGDFGTLGTLSLNRLALAPVSSAVFRVQDTASVQGLQVQVFRSAADSLRWALIRERREADGTHAREAVLLQGSSRGPFAAIIPAALPGAAAIAVFAQVHPWPADPADSDLASVQLSRALLRDVIAARRAHETPSQPPPPGGHLAAGLALPELSQRRSALLFAAVRARAPLCAELCLTADHELLQALCAAVMTSLSEPGALDWRLERSALRLLTDLQSAGKLAFAEEALLLLHTGALARDTARLQAEVALAPDLASLLQQLQASNLQTLADTEPAARLHAYEWLRARGLAPEGFQPLADKASRRAALQALRGDDD